MNFQFDAQEPVRVWYYFEQLSRIPRGSRNTAQVSDYCVAFAREKGLKYRQDEMGNVVIRKDASPGREQEPAVILQGHLDMVAEKQPDSAHDFLKDPLDLRCSGDFVYAEGTTLGGDDGIAIAYSMAVLEDDTLSHPPLVAIFTVDEEIGLLGAAALDMSDIDAKYVLNMDSETEGELIAGCAGGMTSTTTLQLSGLSVRQAADRLTGRGNNRVSEQADGILKSDAANGEPGMDAEPAMDPEPAEEAEPAMYPKPAMEANPAMDPEPTMEADPAELLQILEISVSGLAGGHSGTEIQKERCNAAKLFGRILNDILLKTDVCLIDADFGQKDNAIPCNGSAHILAAKADVPAIRRIVADTARSAAKEHAATDPDLTVRVPDAEFCQNLPFVTPEDTRKVANWLMLAPSGIFYWHPTIPGLVETSLNLGIFRVKENVMTAGHSVRSSVASRKHLLGETLRSLADAVGADYLEAGDYPGWEYREDSRLRPAMVRIYRELFGEEPKVCTIHAGLECGYFMAKKPELDIVSFGPNIYDIHTVKEHISISSVERGYRYVRKILETTL